MFLLYFMFHGYLIDNATHCETDHNDDYDDDTVPFKSLETPAHLLVDFILTYFYKDIQNYE